MSKWGKDIIGSVFLIIRNGASIKQGDVEGGYPITRIETIANGVVDKEKLGYAGINDVNKYKNYILESGDILMSHINSEKHLGKTAIYMKADNEIIIHGMNLLLLRPNYKKITSKFAFYFFQSASFKNQIPRITKKSVNQASFTVTALKELSIPLPPLEEQKRIADILDKASKLIDLRKQQLEKMDLLVKSKFIDMFGDIESNNKNWILKTFRDISNVRQGLQIPISERKTDPAPNRMTYITVQFLNGRKSMEYIENPRKNVICLKNDVLMTRTGNTGKVITDVEGVFHNNFFLIDFDRGSINKQYLVTYLNSAYIQKELLQRAGTSTIPDLNHSEFYKIKFLMPPIILQNKFATFVEQVEKQKAVMQQSLEKMETNYKALMQEYFG